MNEEQLPRPVINYNVGTIHCDCGADFHYWGYTDCPQCGRSYDAALTELANAGYTIRRRVASVRDDEAGAPQEEHR